MQDCGSGYMRFLKLYEWMILHQKLKLIIFFWSCSLKTFYHKFVKSVYHVEAKIWSEPDGDIFF